MKYCFSAFNDRFIRKHENVSGWSDMMWVYVSWHLSNLSIVLVVYKMIISSHSLTHSTYGKPKIHIWIMFKKKITHTSPCTVCRCLNVGKSVRRYCGKIMFSILLSCLLYGVYKVERPMCVWDEEQQVIANSILRKVWRYQKC